LGYNTNERTMKVLLFLFLGFTTSLNAQNAEQLFQALGNNDVSVLAKVLDDDVEVCIRDNTDILSKQQAINRIQRFLNNNKPIKITSMHGGKSVKNKSRYKVARLETTKGVFRVFVYSEGNRKIQEVRFDRF
jgi:hypothetical protein